MEYVQRSSPISLPGEALSLRQDSGWTVVTEYAGETDGPFAVDLSHIGKWDFQSAHLDRADTGGLSLPKVPGDCSLREGILVMRLNPGQAAVWNLGAGPFFPPDSRMVTDVSEGSALLGILGAEGPWILEKLTDLDLSPPGLPEATLWQGPLGGVPCRVVRLLGSDGIPGILVAFSRGYGRDMVSAILEAGREFGLEPGGEQRMTDFLASCRRVNPCSSH